MNEYHKIQTVFKRDMANKGKTLLEGQYSLPEFEYLAKNVWSFTEKVDGTNIRVFPCGNEVRFGGRTDNAQIPTRLLARLQERFPNVGVFRDAFPDCGTDTPVCLYGEGYGAKIQKGGGNYRPDQDFVLFDVRVGDWWLRRPDVEDVAKKIGLAVVPILGIDTLEECVELCRDGFLSMWGDFQAEGIVARPDVELRTRSGHRIITKIKCRDFLRP